MRVGMILSVILFALSDPALSQSRGPSKKDSKPTESPEDKAQRLRPGWAASLEIGIPHPIDIGLGYIPPKADSHIGSFGFFQRELSSGPGGKPCGAPGRFAAYMAMSARRSSSSRDVPCAGDNAMPMLPCTSSETPAISQG